jgi:hypothetical protein
MHRRRKSLDPGPQTSTPRLSQLGQHTPGPVWKDVASQIPSATACAARPREGRPNAFCFAQADEPILMAIPQHLE